MALVDEVGDDINSGESISAPIRKRLRLASALDVPGTQEAQPPPLPVAASGDRLAHRVEDDQQTGNRSGGPAGAYQDPGTDARIADLKQQREKLTTPPPQPKLWQRIAQTGLSLAPVLGAALSRQPGAAVGAEQGMEEGIQRRQHVQDVQQQQAFTQAQTLSGQIEEEEKGREQRGFQWQEELAKERMQQEGMTSREEIAARSQESQGERLAQTIAGQGQRLQTSDADKLALQQLKDKDAQALETQKQSGRMQVQMARDSGNQAVARIRAAAVTGKIPPLVGKAADDFYSSQERFDVMTQNLEAGLRGDQQAQLSLLANHIGMTMGLAKGARINQTIITEAMKSAPWLGRIEARFDDRGYLSGVVLTPEQMQSMVELAQNRLVEDSRKVTDMENYFGVKGHATPTPQAPGQPGGAGGGGAGGAGATSVPKPPGPPHPGMQWQYSPSRKQFREVPVIATKQ